MAPEVRVVMTELLESRPITNQTFVEEEIEEFHEDKPIVDEFDGNEYELENSDFEQESPTEKETADIGPEPILPENSTFSSRQVSTRVTLQIQLLNLEKPLDLHLLNQNISMLNTFIS